jgi:hypothetical protein
MRRKCCWVICTSLHVRQLSTGPDRGGSNADCSIDWNDPLDPIPVASAKGNSRVSCRLESPLATNALITKSYD